MMAVKQKFLLNAKIWFSTDVGIIQLNYVLCQYFKSSMCCLARVIALL